MWKYVNMKIRLTLLCLEINKKIPTKPIHQLAVIQENVMHISHVEVFLFCRISIWICLGTEK